MLCINKSKLHGWISNQISDITYLNRPVNLWDSPQAEARQPWLLREISRINLDTDHDQSSPVRKAKCLMSRSQHPIPHEVLWFGTSGIHLACQKDGWFCERNRPPGSFHQEYLDFFHGNNSIMPDGESLSKKINNWWWFQPSWNIFFKHIDHPP